MLASDIEISKALIDNAIKNLTNDPDRVKEESKTQDDRTLRRGYFHASEDSKNGHSHICTEVNSINDAEFICDFFEKDKLPGNERLDNKFLYKKATIFSSVKATNTTDEVKFYFEDREGISTCMLRKLFDKIQESSILEIYDLPFIPHFSPKVDFEIVNKANPGIQFSDFVLWSVNRCVNGDKTWYDRILSPIKSNYSTQSGSWGGQHIQLGRGLKEPIVNYSLNDFPLDPDNQINKNIYANFYLSAAKTVEYCLNNPTPYTEHLMEEAREVVINKRNLQYVEYFDKLSSSYLKLFDMYPIISPSTSSSDKNYLLLSKKFMSLILRKDLVHGIRTRIWLEGIRRHIVKKNPAILDI